MLNWEFPREDLDEAHADHLSKLVNEDDWRLNVHVYATSVLGKNVLGGKQPTIDIFASELSTKQGNGEFLFKILLQGI